MGKMIPKERLKYGQSLGQQVGKLGEQLAKVLLLDTGKYVAVLTLRNIECLKDASWFDKHLIRERDYGPFDLAAIQHNGPTELYEVKASLRNKKLPRGEGLVMGATRSQKDKNVASELKYPRFYYLIYLSEKSGVLSTGIIRTKELPMPRRTYHHDVPKGYYKDRPDIGYDEE